MDEAGNSTIRVNSQDNAPLWLDFLQNLNFEALQALKAIFKAKEDEILSRDEFNEALTGIGSSISSINQLFDEILWNKSKIGLTWNEFLDFLAQNLDKPNELRVQFNLSKIQPISHTKNETIIKIVSIETEKYFCYAIVSKYGKVGLYDGHLNFLTSYHVIMTREDINRKEEERRRRNRWMTDAIFCPDTLNFIATNSTRSLIIYEASGLKHVPLWLIVTTPNIIQSLAYKNSGQGRKTNESVLFMGDDKGQIISLTFIKPITDGLLRRKYNDQITLFYWDELPNEKSYVIYKKISEFHKDAVRSLRYFPDNGTLLSCSRNSETSVAVKYVENSKNIPYVFKIPKGSNCFALSRVSRILITGSVDGTIRLWDSVIISKPISILKKHNREIIDIEILDNQKMFISCSSDGIFKSWDLTTEKCLQSIQMKFPSFQIFGKFIEWGMKCIYPGPRRRDQTNDEIWERSEILVTCCNYIANIKVNYKELESHQELPILQPPPLQNSVLIPKFWKISEATTIEANFSEKTQTPDDDLIQKRLDGLKFILQRDMSGDHDDINFKIANLERKKFPMQKHVENGAPYLALDLHEIEEVKLTPGLPIPSKKMKTRNLVEKLEKLLENAQAKDVIFSEPSTSSRSPRSSRSSCVEFPY